MWARRLKDLLQYWHLWIFIPAQSTGGERAQLETLHPNTDLQENLHRTKGVHDSFISSSKEMFPDKGRRHCGRQICSQKKVSGYTLNVCVYKGLKQ